MSAPNQATDETGVTIEAITSTDGSTPQVISRKVVTAPSINIPSQQTIAQTHTVPAASGRQVLAGVYINLPRSRIATSGSPTAVTMVNQNNQTGGILLNNVAQVLPPGARPGAFIPGLTQKITVTTTAANNTTASPATQQPHFVTIRSASQSGNSNASVTTQPHFVTIPKESLPDGILKNNQAHQQFVTMVPKSTLGTSTAPGQIVTIRAPLIPAPGGVSSGGNQNPILSIQGPVLQQGTNQATLVPISTASSSGKPHISYISPLLKNGTLPNLVASGPKMVLTTVPTLQKAPHTVSPVSQPSSPTTTQSSTAVPVNSIPVTNIVTIPRGNQTITIVPAKDQTPNPTVTLVPQRNWSEKDALTNQTVTILSSKDSVAGKPTTTILPPKEQATPSSNVSLLSKETPQSVVLSSKDPAPRITGINAVSSKDINTAGSTVTLLSAKDVPAGSPITMISKDSPGFSFLSTKAEKAVKRVTCMDAYGSVFTVLTSGKPVAVVPKDSTTANSTFNIAAPQETSDDNSVTVVSSKDSNQNSASLVSNNVQTPVTVLPAKDTTPAMPTVTLLSSKDGNPGSPTVTLLSSKDTVAGKPTATILPPKEQGTSSPVISKDSPGFSFLSAKEAGMAVKRVTCMDAYGSVFTVLTSGKPAVAVVSSKDSTAANSTTAAAQDASDNNSVTVVSSENPASSLSSTVQTPSVTVLPTNTTPALPTFTLVSSKDGESGNPTVTLLSSKDPSSSTPTVTIVPQEEGLTAVTSADPVPTFTFHSSKEGGHPTVMIVPAKEVAEESNTQEAVPKQGRLTTLPFSLSPEMTVTTTEVPTILYPQFQKIGEDTSTICTTTTAQGFIPFEALIESQKSLDGVNLPESTTLTPVSEMDRAPPKTDLTVTEASIILQKEPVDIHIKTESDTKPAIIRSFAMSNNLCISKPIETEAACSDELSKCLQDAVAAIYASKDTVPSENLQQTAVISCDDDDEVTLTKLSPSLEESKDKFSSLDDPDDIKIELIKCTEVLESSNDTDIDEVSINIDKTRSKSPSPVPQKPPVVSAAKPTKVNNFLSTPKTLSNIRSPSILKSHIANKGRKVEPKLVTPPQHRPQKDEVVKRKEFLSAGKGKGKSKPSLLKAEPKKEIKKENDSPSTPDDFDPVKALEWKKGVGLLPGSNLKFRVNEFGFIEMISDDDKEHDGPKSSQRSSQNSDDVYGSAGSGDEKDVKPEKRKLDAYYEEEEEDEEEKKYDPEDIIRCEHCGVYGMAAEFVNQRYCNTTCQEGAALKKAAEFKREQEHRALKLRRKRRRLERISERGSVEFKKEENSDDPMEVDDAGQSVSKDNSLNPTPIQSDDDALSVTSYDGAEVAKGKGPKAKQATQFTWVKYLESVKAKGAPAKLFKDDGTYPKNKFKVGWKLEGIDPEHPAHFCVLSVAEVKGHRLRLHFDGYSDSHDFWVNMDSPEIFPVGWCQKNNRRLDPPRGFTASTFNWSSYLKSSRAFAAPRHLFTKAKSNTVCPNAFRIGMKLEAVDRKDSSLICVASVADILDNRILVHFDSWDDMYDYWVDPSSPYIHPVGWCSENHRELTPPNEFKDPSTFSWSAYLKQTKSIPAPARAFKQRPSIGFKRGMRLEAVDKRAPQYIRVATVEEAVDHRLLLHFDGWPRIYDYWVDEDCPDIHRPGWCRDTKHPLEAPLTKEDLRDTTHCITPGCRGEGHIKGAKFSSHATVQNCPYSPENMEKEGLIPDRLNPKGDLEYSEIPTPEKGTSVKNVLRLVEGRRPLGRPRKWKRHLEAYHQTKKRRISDNDDGEKRSASPLETASKLQLELHQSVFEPGYRVDVSSNRSACWAKHSLPLHSSPMLTDDTDPQTWGPSDVFKFVSTVAGLREQAEKFLEEEIDGEALLLMTQQDLVDNIGLKLGPAIKLYNCIVLLRQRAA